MICGAGRRGGAVCERRGSDARGSFRRKEPTGERNVPGESGATCTTAISAFRACNPAASSPPVVAELVRVPWRHVRCDQNSHEFCYAEGHPTKRTGQAARETL